MQHHQIYKIEDQIIDRLDRGIPASMYDVELQRIRNVDQWRQRCRLAEFQRLERRSK